MAASRTSAVGDLYTPAPYSGTTSGYIAGATGYGALIGFTCAELKNSTAAFRLHDASSAGATQCLTSLVTLSPLQSAADWYGPQGVAVATGVYIEIVAGNVEVVTYGA